LSFEECREWTIKQNITQKNSRGWRKYIFNNDFIPLNINRHPEKFYKEKWKGWNYWFGLKKPIPNAKTLVCKNKIVTILKNNVSVKCEIIAYTKRFRGIVLDENIHGYKKGSIINFNKKDIVTKKTNLLQKKELSGIVKNRSAKINFKQNKIWVNITNQAGMQFEGVIVSCNVKPRKFWHTKISFDANEIIRFSSQSLKKTRETIEQLTKTFGQSH
jgi:hypothetical protein